MLQVVITTSSSVTVADWGKGKVAIEMVKMETSELAQTWQQNCLKGSCL